MKSASAPAARVFHPPNEVVCIGTIGGGAEGSRGSVVTAAPVRGLLAQGWAEAVKEEWLWLPLFGHEVNVRAMVKATRLWRSPFEHVPNVAAKAIWLSLPPPLGQEQGAVATG